VAPLLVAILRARSPETLQLDFRGTIRRAAARLTVQGFLLGYLCGILLVCRNLLLDLRHHASLWRNATSGRRAGADLVLHVCRALSRNVRAAAGTWLPDRRSRSNQSRSDKRLEESGSKTAASGASIRRALGAAPFLWVAVELARTRITAFPWELLGYSQTANFGLTRIATLTGVYGLSFEIALVNSVFAAAFLAPKRAAEVAAGSGLRRRGDSAGGAVIVASSRRGRSHCASGAAEYSDPRRRERGRNNIFRTRCGT
jgi:hypothetical protein